MESGQRNKMYSFKEKSLMVGHYFAKTMMLKDLATSFDMLRTTISKWLRIIDYDIKNIDRLKPVKKVKKGKVAADIQSLPQGVRLEIDKLVTFIDDFSRYILSSRLIPVKSRMKESIFAVT